MPPPKVLESPAPSSSRPYRKATKIEDLADMDVLLGLAEESEKSEMLPESEDLCIAVFGELAYRSHLASKTTASRPDERKSAEPKPTLVAPIQTGLSADGIEVRIPIRSTPEQPVPRYGTRGSTRTKRKSRGTRGLGSESSPARRAKSPKLSKTTAAVGEATAAQNEVAVGEATAAKNEAAVGEATAAKNEAAVGEATAAKNEAAVREATAAKNEAAVGEVTAAKNEAAVGEAAAAENEAVAAVNEAVEPGPVQPEAALSTSPTPKPVAPGSFQQTEPAAAVSLSGSLPERHESIITPELSPTIGGAKLANTILRVYLPPQEDCVPLRLRSCMTLSTFFESALAAFDIQDQIEKVAALRVTFLEKSGGENNPQWTQLVKRGIPDSFEIFLDMVNELQDLKAGGRSQVKVEIIMKA